MVDWQALIAVERAGQDAKWGEQNHGDEKWLAILVEEVGELAQAILNGGDGGEEELIHVAAVAVAWMEAIGRRHD